MNINDDSIGLILPRAQTIGKHVGVIGMTGSGKTNTEYVWCEEEIREGGQLTILDSEGDYHHLKVEFPDLLIVGKGRRGNPIDVQANPGDGARLAELLVRRGISVILDLSGMTTGEKNAFVLGYVGRMWAIYQNEDLPAHRLVVDEVQLFAPQGPTTESKELLQDLAARARKRGLGLLVATQRPQQVDKAILDATDIRFFHKVQRGRTLQAIADLVPGELANIKAIIPALQPGECFFVRGDAASIIHVRQSDTFRPGEPMAIPAQASGIDAKLLADLQALLARPIEQPVGDKGRVARLEARIAELEIENEQLKAQVNLLGKIQIVVPAAAPAGVMDVEQINTQRLVAATAIPVEGNGSGATMTPPAGLAIQPPAAPKSNPPAEDTYRSPRATLRAYNKQNKDFDTLLRDLRDLPRFHKILLSWLIDHDNESFGFRRLARYIGVEPYTIINKPPLRLLELGLIGRVEAKENFQYFSTARQTLQARFPDLDTDVLLGRLIKACEV